jgi:hypothetical protein
MNLCSSQQLRSSCRGKVPIQQIWRHSIPMHQRKCLSSYCVQELNKTSNTHRCTKKGPNQYTIQCLNNKACHQNYEGVKCTDHLKWSSSDLEKPPVVRLSLLPKPLHGNTIFGKETERPAVPKRTHTPTRNIMAVLNVVGQHAAVFSIDQIVLLRPCSKWRSSSFANVTGLLLHRCVLKDWW